VIRYALTCDNRHGFESWFKSSTAYDEQVARGLLACPVCGSSKVEKAMMAPTVTRPQRRAPKARAPAGEDKSPVALISEHERELRGKLKELRDQLIKNADYVGPKFAEEARKMHYGEIEHRSIYGEASPEEASSLLDDGIEFHPLPYLPNERN
jgi:hypothetical protein